MDKHPYIIEIKGRRCETTFKEKGLILLDTSRKNSIKMKCVDDEGYYYYRNLNNINKLYRTKRTFSLSINFISPKYAVFMLFTLQR